jgi:hypothetical protein
MEKGECPKCGTMNPPTSKYCGECATELNPVRQQIVTAKKRKRSGARVVMALVVLLIVLLGAFFIPAYPRLQVEDVTLIPAFSPLFRPNLSVVIQVQIVGRNMFHIDHVSVGLGDVSCYPGGAITSSLILPGDVVVVAGCDYFGSHTTTLAVTIDGTWSLFPGVQIPVSVSSTFPVHQSAWHT